MPKKKKYAALEVIPAPDVAPRKRKSKARRPAIFLMAGTVAVLLIIVGIGIVLPIPQPISTPVPGTVAQATPIYAGEYVEDMAQSGDHILIAGSDTLRLYDNNHLIRLFDGYNFSNPMHSNRVAVAFRPGSNEFVSLTTARASDEPYAELTVWNQEDGTIIRRFTAHEGGFSNIYWGVAVAYSPDGKWLASGAGDATIALWDAENGDLLTRFPADFVTGTQALAFSLDGQRLAATIYTGSEYGASHRGAGLHIWALNNLENPARVFSQPLPFNDLHWTGFSPDGRYFAAASDRNPENYDIQIWDLETLLPVSEINLPHDVLASSIVSLAFSPDNTRLTFIQCRLLQASTAPGIPAIEDVRPRVFDWRTRQETAAGPALDMKGAYEMRFSPDGNSLQYVDASDHTLRRWHIGTDVVEMLGF